jgi:hypothetical protein
MMQLLLHKNKKLETLHLKQWKFKLALALKTFSNTKLALQAVVVTAVAVYQTQRQPIH